MSLHNLATVFGPTLLRPSEVESKAHLTSAADIWSHDVMAQVAAALPGPRAWGSQRTSAQKPTLPPTRFQAVVAWDTHREAG